MAPVTFPPKRDDAKTRGQALAYWLQTHRNPRDGRDWTQHSFALESGFLRANLNRYIAGAADLANLDQHMVERLLGTMGMSDLRAREYFGIPKDAWPRWRTFRSAPLGHGASPERSGVRAEPLTEPLRGDVTAPAGLTLKFDTEVMTGLVVVRVGTQFWTMRRETPQDAVPGELLGGFVAVEGGVG